MLDLDKGYDAAYAAFKWDIPEFYNIGVDICDKWADLSPDRTAIIQEDQLGRIFKIDFCTLKRKSDNLAHNLQDLGLKSGDRVAVLLPQCIETAIAHIAIFKAGAISVPLSLLFGEEALQYRLEDAGVSFVITNTDGQRLIKNMRNQCESIRHIISLQNPISNDLDFEHLCNRSDELFTATKTRPDDPALIIYTSGTTGPPKGALHAHRVLCGHLPGVVMPHEGLPQKDDLFWTPADWAWAGGLLDILLPALHFGIPVLAHRFQKFTPHDAFSLMERHSVRNAFIPPTALKLLRTLENPTDQYNLSLRTIGTGGEALGAETYRWAKQALGVEINEFYGQTECNLVLSSSHRAGVIRPGAIGKPVPGHVVAVVDSNGNEVSVGTLGNIAIKQPDPVMFLGYWNNPDATAKKYLGDWLLTGDQGKIDTDGYFYFTGRDDDIITSSGYRIGPGEVEDCLVQHPAVALSAVIGKPDPLRTEIVKAFIVLREGHLPTPELAKELQEFVKSKLAAHEYPREISFRKELPMTTTGKIIRNVLKQEEALLSGAS